MQDSLFKYEIYALNLQIVLLKIKIWYHVDKILKETIFTLLSGITYE